MTEHPSLGVVPRDIPRIAAVTANAFEFDALLFQKCYIMYLCFIRDLVYL